MGRSGIREGIRIAANIVELLKQGLAFGFHQMFPNQRAVVSADIGHDLPISLGFRHQPFGLRPPEYQRGYFKALPFHSTLWIISSTKRVFIFTKQG